MGNITTTINIDDRSCWWSPEKPKAHRAGNQPLGWQPIIGLATIIACLFQVVCKIDIFVSSWYGYYLIGSGNVWLQQVEIQNQNTNPANVLQHTIVPMI